MCTCARRQGEGRGRVEGLEGDARMHNSARAHTYRYTHIYKCTHTHTHTCTAPPSSRYPSDGLTANGGAVRRWNPVALLLMLRTSSVWRLAILVGLTPKSTVPAGSFAGGVVPCGREAELQHTARHPPLTTCTKRTAAPLHCCAQMYDKACTRLCWHLRGSRQW